MHLKITLRNGSFNESGFHFALPLARVWWDNVVNDLHLQFAGHEERNICPSDNAFEDELLLPEEATIFWDWLKTIEPLSGLCRTARSCMVESGPVPIGIVPPKAALDDLVNHWVSPND